MNSAETKHVKYFKKAKCKPTEQVIAFLDGWIGEMMGSGKDTQHNGALVLTNERVSFIRKGFLGEVFQTIPFEKITSIETRSFMGYRVVAFHTSHDDLTFKTFEPANLFQSFHDEVEKLRTGSKLNASPAQTSSLDKIRKLAELRDIGIISEDEFAAKKTELLKQF